MTNPSDWYRRPHLILADLVGKHARGETTDRRHYYRASVLAVDLEGGQLQNKNASGSFAVRQANGQVKNYAAIVGPENPRGSIKARILTNGMDRLLDDDDVRVFWPMFPHDQIGLPVSPGEHVYVVFEGSGMDHGLWISRVSGQDSANTFQGVDSYTAPNAPVTAMDSFEPNEPEYQRTDQSAGLAPPSDATKFFDKGE